MTHHESLIEDYLNGQRVVYKIGSVEVDVLFTPAFPGDPSPWTFYSLRFRSDELTAVPCRQVELAR